MGASRLDTAQLDTTNHSDRCLEALYYLFYLFINYDAYFNLFIYLLLITDFSLIGHYYYYIILNYSTSINLNFWFLIN